MKRLIGVILTLTLVLSLAACSNGGAEPTPGAQIRSGEKLLGSAGSYVYGAEVIPLDLEGSVSLGSAALTGGRLMFVYTDWVEDYSFWSTRMAACDLDGGNIELFETLETNGNLTILREDGEGGVWCGLMGRDTLLSDGSISMNNRLIRYNGKGEEIQSFTMPELGQHVNAIPIYLAFDSDGLMYLRVSFGDSPLCVYDISAEPRQLFSLDIGYEAGVAVTADGRAAVCAMDESGCAVSLVDAAARELAEVCRLPTYYTVVDGVEGQDLYIDDGANLFGLDLETGGQTKLLNWVSCGIQAFGQGFLPLGEGRFLMRNDEDVKSFLLLSQRYIEHEPVTVTLATAGGMYSSHQIVMAAAQFNRTHHDVKIELLDYSIYSDVMTGDMSQGLLLLTTELIAGNFPDILDLSSLPVRDYAKKGMLEDLYPFIDSDPDMERGDFFDSVFRSLEFDGKLLELTPTYLIETAAVSGPYADAARGLSFAEAEALVQNDPRLETAFGLGLSRAEFLEKTLIFNMPILIDWEAGTCEFNGDFFIGALEAARAIPEESVTGHSTEFGWEWDYDEQSMLANGRQLYLVDGLMGLAYMRFYTDRLGDDFQFVGFPCADGKGSAVSPAVSLAMSAKSEHKDECWQFLRSFLLSEGHYGDGLPLRRDIAQRAIDNYLTQLADWIENNNYQISPKIEEAIQKALDLIESADKPYRPDKAVQEIVMDETAAYFSGDRSAEDTAARIQSRVSIYVAEQAG